MSFLKLFYRFFFPVKNANLLLSSAVFLWTGTVSWGLGSLFLIPFIEMDFFGEISEEISSTLGFGKFEIGCFILMSSFFDGKLLRMSFGLILLRLLKTAELMGAWNEKKKKRFCLRLRTCHNDARVSLRACVLACLFSMYTYTYT